MTSRQSKSLMKNRTWVFSKVKVDIDPLEAKFEQCYFLTSPKKICSKFISQQLQTQAHNYGIKKYWEHPFWEECYQNCFKIIKK
jgi:hypothetical protein